MELICTAYDHPEHTGSHDFNTGLLCCLPKKATGVHEIHGEFYGAGDTRPLAIVNTDNRLIASAMRLAWEPLLNSWISKAQRGFLKGRSMLMNILDIDEKAMTVSLKEAYGGLVSFHFRAAFQTYHTTSSSLPCSTSASRSIPVTRSSHSTVRSDALFNTRALRTNPLRWRRAFAKAAPYRLFYSLRSSTYF